MGKQFLMKHSKGSTIAAYTCCLAKEGDCTSDGPGTYSSQKRRKFSSSSARFLNFIGGLRSRN